jgi:hypothetical protein
MDCSICGQPLDRSGLSTGVRWLLCRKNRFAADDMNGDLCAECGEQIERKCQSGTPADYELTKRPRDSNDVEHGETVYPVRMAVVEDCRPET